MEFYERLEMALEHAKQHHGLNQQQVADVVRQLSGSKKFRQQNLSELKRRKAKSSGLSVPIAMACRISPLWLVLEQGEMLDQSSTLSANAIRIAAKFDRLAPSNQRTVSRVIDGFIMDDMEPGTNNCIDGNHCYQYDEHIPMTRDMFVSDKAYQQYEADIVRAQNNYREKDKKRLRAK